MEKVKILWTDDEIDLLVPHILFLEGKGYSVSKARSGDEAIDLYKSNVFDIVFLDENMPGLSGLEVLVELKKINKNIPVVMITKSEEEYIMEEAIGGEISDYLIKPVNPNQILLSIKKNLDEKRLVSEKSLVSYQKEFRNLSMKLQDRLDFEEWIEVYQELVYWEIKLSKGENKDMLEVLESQKTEANNLFSRYIEKNYEDWFSGKSDAPLLSHQVLEKTVFPLIGKEPVFVFVIDCMRWDQWKTIQSYLADYYTFTDEKSYYAILPTATQYARNALFAGLMPLDIQKKYPNSWLEENDEGSKNNEEKFLVGENLLRHNYKVKFRYEKVLNIERSKRFVDQIKDYMQNDINFIVYNFVDMLSHASTDTKIIRELADDENGYRGLTESWFKNSPLLDAFKKLASMKCKVVITTDHGSVKINQALKMMGEKEINTNLRYKVGKNMQYNPKDVFEVNHPDKIRLPKQHLSDRYIFAKDKDFFAYQNNFNYYANYYKDTFQHGGISLEEMIVPLVFLQPK